MNIKYLTLLLLFAFFNLNAQRNPEFQDPADWIPLIQSFGNVSTSITPRVDQLPEMYSAPVDYVSEKENDLFPLGFKTRYFKFGFDKDGEEVVQFWGTIDLSCCKNKPVKVEFLDKDDKPIHFLTTEEDGSFKAIGPNGGIKWLNKPSEKDLKRMRKKAKRAHKKELKYLKELRNRRIY